MNYQEAVRTPLTKQELVSNHGTDEVEKWERQGRIALDGDTYKLRPTALGCNIFAGGFASGVFNHFNILAHFEESNYFVETFKANFPHVPAWMNIVSWPTHRFKGKVDFCYNNPPCAPWSGVGVTCRRGGDAWKSDPRVQCVWNSFSLLDKLEPKVWLWESVPRAASPGGGRDLVLEVIRQAQERGYSATELFNAAWMHGIPQRRRRFMLILHKVEIELPEPEPVIRSVRDVMYGIEPDPDAIWLTDEKAELYHKTPMGGSLRTTFDSEFPELRDKKGVVGRPPFSEWRIHWDGLSGVITSHNAQLHPDEPRYLGNNEVHRICQYPEDWVWRGPRKTWRAQMAQAVMPNVAEYVARCIAKSLENERPKTELTHELVDWTEGKEVPFSESRNSARRSKQP